MWCLGQDGMEEIMVWSTWWMWTEGEKFSYTGWREKGEIKQSVRREITIESSGFPSALASSVWVPFSTICALSACAASCVNEMIRFYASGSNRIRRKKIIVLRDEDESHSICISHYRMTTEFTFSSNDLIWMNPDILSCEDDHTLEKVV